MLSSKAVRASLPLRRSFATASTKTQYTQLSNGVTVATESNSLAKAATVGLYYGAGSTSETYYNSGVSALLNRVITSANEAEANKKGLNFGATTQKEFVGYFTQGLPSSTGDALDLLNAKVANATFDEAAIQAQRPIVAKAAETFEETNYAGKVLEHLHATAFQNTPLALPTHGDAEVISTLEKYDLDAFTKKNYVDSNLVVVGSGAVNHDEFVAQVEKKLSIPSGAKPTIPKAKFLGSEIRMRDDTLPKAYISIAAQGEALNSPNYYVAKVAAEIFGSYNYNEPSSKYVGVKLNDVVNETHLADTYNHFSLSYSNAGLWGLSTEISNIHQIDDFVHFALKEWNRLTISITETEVFRAKQLLKTKVLFELNSPLAVSNDIANKVLNQGRKPSTEEIFAEIEKITVKDIKNWASERLWDQDIAVSGTGQIEDLLDYMRMRNDMSMMRW